MNDYQLNLASKVMSAASGVVVSVILARYLGVADRGAYAFITQASGLVALVAGFGINQTFPYFFRRASADRSVYVLFMRLIFIQCCLCAVLSIAVWCLVQEASVRLMAIVLAPTLLYQQVESVMAAYAIRLKIRVNMILSVTRIAVHLFMYWLTEPNLIWPLTLGAFLWLAVGITYWIAAGPFMPGIVSARRLREILSFSWLPMLTTLLVVMNYNVDTLMLKWMGSSQDLGHYAVAAGLIVYLWVVPDAIKEVLVSRVARTRVARVVVLPLKAGIAAAILCGVGLAATGWVLVPLMFGEQFRASYPLAVVLSLGVVSMAVYKILGVYLLADGRRGAYFVCLAISVALNVAINCFAIPMYGSMGAAWATVGSYTLTGLLFAWRFSVNTGVGWREMFILTPSDFRSLRKGLGS